MNKGSIVKLTKFCGTPNGLPAGNWDTWVAGQLNDLNRSLPIDYSIEGTLLENVQIGKPVEVLRTKRNGIEALGAFQSSIVQKITGKTFTTLNSVYQVEVL